MSFRGYFDSPFQPGWILQYRVILLLEESTQRKLWLSISGGRGSAEPRGSSFAHWRRARLKGANGKQLRSFRAGIQPNSDYALAQASRALHVCVFVFLMVAIVQKLHRRQSRVMMHGVTLAYNNQQSGASQLLSTAIIFLILSNRKTEFN